MKKVLLIGNGPSLLDSERGKEIDEFNGKIIRCNGYKIYDYEKYVGTRTDVLVLGKLDQTEILKYQYDYILLYQSRLDGGRGLRRIKQLSPHNEIKFFPLNEKDKIKDLLQMPEHKEPTTGIIAMYWFMRPDIELYLFGFDFFSRGGEYFSKELLKRKIDCHDPEREKIYAEWLCENNYFKWF